MTAAQRRTAVAYVQTSAGVSQRRACRWLAVSRTPVRYVAHPRHDDAPLRDRLRELAEAHPRWGAPVLTWKLQREGWRDNHKRIERVYRQEGLAVRKRRRKAPAPAQSTHAGAGAERPVVDGLPPRHPEHGACLSHLHGGGRLHARIAGGRCRALVPWGARGPHAG